MLYTQPTNASLSGEDVALLEGGDYRQIELFLKTRTFSSSDLFPISQSLVRHGYVELFKYAMTTGLYQAGFIGLFYNLRINLQNPVFNSLLSIAAKFNQVEMGRCLIRAGSPISWNDFEAFKLAYKNDHADFVLLLTQKNELEVYWLIDALRDCLTHLKCPKVVRLLINQPFGLRLFETCATHNDVQRIKFCLEQGINPNLTNAFALAIDKQHEPLISFFLNNVFWSQGPALQNALYAAIVSNKEKMVCDILELGACLTADGYRAFILGLHSKDKAVRAIFEKLKVDLKIEDNLLNGSGNVPAVDLKQKIGLCLN